MNANMKMLKDIAQAKILVPVTLVNFTVIGEYFQRYIVHDTGMLHILVLLVLLDFVTGVTKAWVKEGWTSVTSRGFRDSVGKIVQYGGFVIVTNILTLPEVSGDIVTNSATLIRYSYYALYAIEIKSILENITAINPKLDILNTAVKKLLAIGKAITSKNKP